MQLVDSIVYKQFIVDENIINLLRRISIRKLPYFSLELLVKLNNNAQKCKFNVSKYSQCDWGC